ncbi:hypothetical protein [Massilioclostridium coli]|uniref:hypothetical protein n=1 Tax=Massilioclostridium coli TaxID=1870991 RepID=UPI00085C64F9|nr:hypothetical protein [Massilioclostridium coli]
MTTADKKQCLLQLRTLEEQIKKADEERIEAIAALNSTAINYSGLPSGNGKHNKIELGIERVQAAQEEVNRLIDQKEAIKKELLERIKQCPTRECRILLRCKYIKFMTWAAIAKKLGVSKEHTRKYLHLKALKEFK